MSYYSEAIAKHMYTHMATEGKEEYEKFFRSALKKFNIKSPAELDDSKKKEFFNYIEKNYKAKNEDLVGEGVLKENPAVIATAARMAIQNKQGKKVSVNTARQKDYAEKDPGAHKKAVSLFQRIKDKFKKKDDPKKPSASKKKSDAQKYADLYGGGAKVESTKEYGKTLDKMARDRKLKNISKKDKELLAKIAQMMKSANESKLSSKIRKAILVAIGMSGNMTGAVKKIEKMAKGLSNDPKVAAALRLANESTITMDKDQMGKLHSDGEIILVDPDGKEHKIIYNESVLKETPADWNHNLSRVASEISRAMKMAGIKVIKHTPYKAGFRRGDAALYGAFIKTKDKDGKETILPIEIDKKGIIRYAGGPNKWHPLEIIGALNMSHAKPDDYLKIKSIARTKDYLKQFKKMPGFGQDVIRKVK